jgi:hypothetical protein
MFLTPGPLSYGAIAHRLRKRKIRTAMERGSKREITEPHISPLSIAAVIFLCLGL